MKKVILLLISAIHLASSYDNGLARKPPMGWLSWSRFACEVDCAKHPNDCINDQLYQTTADAMADGGFLAAGYEYVNIDDCWSLKERDPTTLAMIPDASRFPKGIKGVADYVHSKGLKFGLYSDIGTHTCAGYPGHLNEKGKSPPNFFDVDAKSFSGWEIDSLKVDGCFIEFSPSAMDPEYQGLSVALNKTNRPILLFCSGPFFQGTPAKGNWPVDKIDFERYQKFCNGWRFYEDIWPNTFNRTAWESILDIIDFYKKNVGVYEEFHGPGSWFDPDTLIIGNDLLNRNQEEAHMAIWAVMAAPLIMSNDVRRMSQASKDILLNKEVIAVDQDPAGLAGKPVVVEGDREVWVKELTADKVVAFAVVYFNRGGIEAAMSYKLADILPEVKEGSFKAVDLFRGTEISSDIGLSEYVTLSVPSTGVRMMKLMKK